MVASLLLIVSSLIGCSEEAAITPSDDEAPGGATTESEAMKYFATSDEFVANDDITFGDEALEPTDAGMLLQLNSSIIPISWGRFVDQVTVTTSTVIEDGDSVATVQVSKDITGTFRILAKYSETDTTTILIEKPFTDHSVRNVLFKRVGREVGRFWLNWVPVATSLVDGATVNPPADQVVNITELQLVKPNGDTITVTDPTNFYLRYGWRFLKDDRAVEDVPQLFMNQVFSVRATVVSASPDTDLVVLKHGYSATTHNRTAMSLISQAENGDGTYTRIYEVSAAVRHQPGFFHAGVLVLTKKTLYDDDPANYSVNWWGVPYRVL
jgi:hypothetical protein